MSLTSFLDIQDVKEAFHNEFGPSPIRTKKKLLAPPRTRRFGLIGTAFDYLLRFYIKRLNPFAVESPWVSISSLRLLLLANLQNWQKVSVDHPIWGKLLEKASGNPDLRDSLLLKQAVQIVMDAKKAYQKYIQDGAPTSELLSSVLRLAQVDRIYRTQTAPKRLGEVDPEDMKDLESLLKVVPRRAFKAKKVCLLNPTFGHASTLVGGADCDLVIDDALIEIKTTTRPALRKDGWHQLVGYYCLYRIGGIKGMPANHEITKLGVYFARHGDLVLMDVASVIDESRFGDFLNWFKERAIREFGRIPPQQPE